MTTRFRRVLTGTAQANDDESGELLILLHAARAWMRRRAAAIRSVGPVSGVVLDKYRAPGERHTYSAASKSQMILRSARTGCQKRS